MKRNAFMLTALAVTLTAHVSAETLVGLTNQDSLAIIDSANPAVVINTAPITGVQAGDDIIALDMDPNTGDIIGLGTLNFLYRLDPLTGAASLIGDNPINKVINGNNVTLEVDPVIGDIRLLDDTGLNMLLDPVLGLINALGGLLLYPLGDPNFLQVPEIINGAIDNLNLGEDAGILYLIDLETGSLVQLVGGLISTLHTVAPLTGVDLDNLIGFDIATSGTALIAQLLPNGLGTEILGLDLTNGLTNLLGSVNLIFEDITIISPPPADEDTDGDGVPNASDRCPDTPETDVVDQFGCSIHQLCPCEGPRIGGAYGKKGYSKCIKAQTKRLVKAGIITKVERKTLSKMSKTSPCNPLTK